MRVLSFILMKTPGEPDDRIAACADDPDRPEGESRMKTAFGLALTAGAALVLTAGAAVAGPPGSQKYNAPVVDTSQRASYGEIYLSSGFTPDPYRVNLTSGGGVDATNIASGCVGMVARSPDFQLNYDASSLPLIFGVTSSNDTTLVINGPDGRWYCDDDSGDGSNPVMRIPNPPSGIYDVFVGAYGGNGGSAQLYITELDSQVNGGGGNTAYDSGNSYSGLVDSTLNASFGSLNLSSGFTSDPRTIRIQSGGSISAQDVASHCRGFIARAPDAEVRYSAGSLPLIFSVSSNSDTTLVINGPDGQWYCDDDGGNNGMNPALRFNSPMSGTYDVWVGSYRSGDGSSSTLYVSELTSQ